MQFLNKTVVVTGGANGIGRCVTELFLAGGANLAVVDLDAASGNALIRRYGENVLFMEGDIAEQDVQTAFAAAVCNRFGGVDCLINNACVSRRGLLSDCGYEDFTYVLRLGVTAPYMLTKFFLSAFKPQASIVNIVSSRAFMSQADTESYSAAKGGISALTHALSVSLAGKVRVNAVSPGWIDTGAYQHEPKYTSFHSEADGRQHPAGRVGKPEDVAAMVFFLCGTGAGFITGQNFVVDGGMTRQMIYHDDCGWTFSPKSADIR